MTLERKVFKEKRMKNETYKKALGCVVSYKVFYEPLLFNELNVACPGIKLIMRGESSAAFLVPDYARLVSAVHSYELIFLQHVHPFMYQTEISGEISDFAFYMEMLEQITGLLSYDDKITCQCRIDSKDRMGYSNRDLTELLASALEQRGYCVSPVDAEVAVSLTVFQNTAYLGISRLKDNVSDWTGGVLFYSKGEDTICRAEFKIEEACKAFGIEISEGLNALDLGAAPGGWSHYLSKQGMKVDAVDPADLDKGVLECKNVVHYKMTAQEFVETNPDECYDIIVNDMKMDTKQSVDILCEMCDRLKPGGGCLLTLKLPKSNVLKRIQAAKQMLGRRFETIQIRQLYYNRSEVTVYAKGRL